MTKDKKPTNNVTPLRTDAQKKVSYIKDALELIKGTDNTDGMIVVMDEFGKACNITEADLQENYKDYVEEGFIRVVEEDPTGNMCVDDIKAFHHLFKVEKGLTLDNLELRIELMKEEFNETLTAFTKAIEDMQQYGHVTTAVRIELLDGLIDQTVINVGTADVLGFDFAGGWDEVISSNLSKINKDGSVDRRADGKVLKGEDYKAPDLGDYV